MTTYVLIANAWSSPRPPYCNWQVMASDDTSPNSGNNLCVIVGVNDAAKRQLLTTTSAAIQEAVHQPEVEAARLGVPE